MRLVATGLVVTVMMAVAWMSGSAPSRAEGRSSAVTASLAPRPLASAGWRDAGLAASCLAMCEDRRIACSSRQAPGTCEDDTCWFALGTCRAACAGYTPVHRPADDGAAE